MGEIDSANQATDLAHKYAKEAFEDDATIGTKKVSYNEKKGEWDVILSITRRATGLLTTDNYRVLIDGQDGHVKEFEPATTDGSILGRFRDLVNSIKDLILSILFLIRELKGKNF